MKSLAYIFLICLALACSEPREHTTALDRTLYVMKKHPDSALHILDSLGEHEQQFGQHFRMQYRLHRTNILNRLDTLFRTTDEAQQLADYFDSHGTPNEKMLAYYLLGRTYYDTGEMPMAMKCYQEAVSKADTTAQDCDYAQLSRVYGQISNILGKQNLFQKELEYTDIAMKYSFKAKDTLNALLNMAEIGNIFENMGKADSAIATYNQAASLLDKHKRTDISASILGCSILLLLEKGDINKAKQYMDIYEDESGFFNSKGNIEPGREVYYYSKGQYYLSINRYDSAEYWFRKELHYGKDFNNQNAASRGLALLFQKTNRPDSAAKYALYSYEMNDSCYDMATAEKTNEIQAMYNYARNQKIAKEEREKVYTERKRIYILISVLFILTISTVLFIRHEKKKYTETYNRYIRNVVALTKAKSEIDRLREYKKKLERLMENNKIQDEHLTELQQIIYEKEKRLIELQAQMNETNKTKYLKNDTMIQPLMQHEHYASFTNLASKGLSPTPEQWEQITATVKEVFPGFYNFISAHSPALNEKEFQTCLLIRLYIKPKEIANMVGVTPAYISKIRQEMIQKLFGINGSSKDFDKKIQEII